MLIVTYRFTWKKSLLYILATIENVLDSSENSNIIFLGILLDSGLYYRILMLMMSPKND